MGWRKLDEGGRKIQTFNKVNKICGCNVLCNMMAIVNTSLWYLKVVNRVDPKTSHHKKKNLHFLYLYEMMNVKYIFVVIISPHM